MGPDGKPPIPELSQEDLKKRKEFFRKIALREQQKTGKLYGSIEAKELDIKTRELKAVVESLIQMLVISRDRLKPFLDEGFVHDDRQIKQGKDKGDGPKASDARTLDRVKNFKWQMGHYLKENNLEGVETLIRELTEDMLLTVENTTLYEDV